MNLKCAAGLFLLLSTVSLSATTLSERFSYDLTGKKFGSPELRWDVFGTWRAPDGEIIGDGHLGIGAGVNYFFCNNWGFGADTSLEELDIPNHFNVSFIGRYPLEDPGFAPYVFVGGGRQFSDGTSWTAHIGGGAEYRINRVTGLFIDVRRTFREAHEDAFLFRTGLRFGF